MLSLNPPGHTTLLSEELSRLRISLAGLQEVRWLGHGETDISDNFRLLWSGHEDSRIQGVALVIHRRFVPSIANWKPLGPRMLYVRLKHSQGYVSVFTCYAPTDNADSEAKELFYRQLKGELRRVSRHDITVILGDMNATIGPSRAGLESIVGPHPSDIVASNDNGIRLLELCASHNLKLLGTWFQHRQIHRTTWYSNTGTTSKTIDHILVSGRWKIASDCRVYRSAELGNTDHRLLAATLHLHLRSNTPRSHTLRRPPDIDKLREPTYAHRFSIEVSNRFAALESPQNLEDGWNQFRATLIPAATEVLGERRPKKRPWISEASLNLVDRCRQARLHGTMPSYRDLSKQRRRNLRHDFGSWLNRIADVAETSFRAGNLRPAYKALRDLCQAGNLRRSSPLLDDAGNLITEPQAKLHRWSQHYASVLCKPPPPPSDRLRAFADAGVADDTISLDPPSLRDVIEIIRKLPSGRAPGADGITGEMLKAASDAVAPRLHALFQRVWEAERVPVEWKEGIILSFYKNKGDRRCTSNYRPITLLSVPSKVLTTLVLKRIQPLLLAKRRPQQAGFTPTRSTTDCILTLRVLAQQRRMFLQPLYAAYVDLKAAFDSLDRSVLWSLLQGIGVPTKLISILKDLYSNTTCRVRAEGSMSDPFSTTSGVRQGCVAAPNLFNIAVDYWLHHTITLCPHLGVDYHHRFTDLCYADDAVIFATLLDTISDALSILGEAATPLGLSINWAKTKVQSLSDFIPPPPPIINVNSEHVEAVDKFIYLGSMISSDCSSNQEIDRRIQLAHKAFGRLNRVWRSSKIRTSTKIRILNTCVLPILLYGCESWSFSVSISHRLDAYHRNCLRYILGIRWYHFVSNQEVYSRAGDPTPLSITIKRSRLRLLGHVARYNDRIPAKRILTAASHPPPEGWSRPRGRPRLSWVSQVSATRSLPDLLDLAQDRRDFRRLVATVN